MIKNLVKTAVLVCGVVFTLSATHDAYAGGRYRCTFYGKNPNAGKENRGRDNVISSHQTDDINALKKIVSGWKFLDCVDTTDGSMKTYK